MRCGSFRSIPGTALRIVTVSFNNRPTRGGAGRREKAHALSSDTRPGSRDAWHFLTGDQPSIDRLTGAAGYRYVWDRATSQFAHPTEASWC